MSPDPGLYHFINQGVLTVDGIDDDEEMKITDVSTPCTVETHMLEVVKNNALLLSLGYTVPTTFSKSSVYTRV